MEGLSLRISTINGKVKTISSMLDTKYYKFLVDETYTFILSYIFKDMSVVNNAYNLLILVYYIYYTH